ncbi:MAG: LysM peptidoglycan-binding domain-containing protein, partial [Pseudomonadota bacterium]|nr:LysM peptidoglycan-binding domain-containing protein [Pseudomonadota bacterium]
MLGVGDNRMVGAASAGSVARISTDQGVTSYTIRRGDTLGALARQFGTDVATLARMNGIANPDRTFAGAQLKVPTGGAQQHVVTRGENLTVIARSAGVSLAELLRANPQISNPDVIYPGQRISIPHPDAEAAITRFSSRSIVPAEGAGSVNPVGQTRFEGGTLSLSQTDIDNLKRTLQTEWVQSAGDAQAHGVIDTILNRVASGHWGGSVADVVNADRQFSDINGPVAWRDGRNSVEQIPMSQVSARVDQLVDSYLAQRAAGRPSSIGTHLNYANPHYSDAVNLGWINALDGPVLGRGDAVHHHGTTAHLERVRPDAFAITLPGETDPSRGAGSVEEFDGRVLAAQVGIAVKNGRVDIESLHPAMDPVMRAVAQAADQLGLPQPVITSGNDSTHS